MKIKNKIELKKAIICSVIVLLVFLIIFGVINYFEYRCYNYNFNIVVNSIVAKVIEENPNIEKNELIELFNNIDQNKENMFYAYGIDFKKDSLLLKNDLDFSSFMAIDLFILLILGILIAFIFLKYNKSKDKKIEEITRYIEEINNRNYKLYIEDNTEDELSILKNEIYKTTVMLKEIAENSKQDKINLKDSLSDISHQLKTPLTSIVIMLDNILDNQSMDKDMRNEFLKDIKREIININFLVISLLKLSKLDASSVSFTNKDEHIIDIVEESLKNVSVICDLKNIKINVTGDNSAIINCDMKWQIEALTNIIKNCIEHSKYNSSIDISFEENKMYSKIEIKDYGVGIDKKDLPHIFERFYKGKNSSNDSVGIGLALAKSIIDKNNGYITVESKLGEGTKFTIKYFKK